jgi:HPt (histidine-containing phosphotransfer) domain-containing protein
MDEKELILDIFSKTNIDGLNLAEGIARFGGNPKLYMKIIKTYVDNIGSHLDTLAGLTPEGLEAYGIEVHGVKGSCYGISANKEGDMAKELEIAAKENNYDKVLAGNAPFIAAVNELKANLQNLLDEVSGGSSGGNMKPEPDKAVLAVMLNASRSFDVEEMQEALKELEKYQYEKDGELVKWLGEQVTAFGYDLIEERLAAIL